MQNGYVTAFSASLLLLRLGSVVALLRLNPRTPTGARAGDPFTWLTANPPPCSSSCLQNGSTTNPPQCHSMFVIGWLDPASPLPCSSSCLQNGSTANPPQCLAIFVIGWMDAWLIGSLRDCLNGFVHCLVEYRAGVNVDNDVCSAYVDDSHYSRNDPDKHVTTSSISICDWLNGCLIDWFIAWLR